MCYEAYGAVIPTHTHTHTTEHQKDGRSSLEEEEGAKEEWSLSSL